jgi:hypothetical protein
VKLVRATLFVSVAAAMFGLASCADSKEEPFTPPVDTPDSGLPSQDATTTLPEAAADAAPRTCSDHGFCPTAVPADQTLRGVWGDGTGVAWAVSAEGKVLRWDGTAWKVHASGFGALNAIWGSSATDVWIAGEGGMFHGTGASSAALELTPSTLPEAETVIHSVWGASASDVWAVGVVEDDLGMTSPQVLHYTAGDAGSAWSKDDVSNEAMSFSHVWGSPGSGVWLAGIRPNIDDPYFYESVVLRKLGKGAFEAETLPADPEGGVPWGRMQTVQGAVAASDSSVWIYGRGSFPGIWKGTSSDNGVTFTWSRTPDGDPAEPMWTALAGTGNDVWGVGEYGRVRRWTGTEWVTTAITPTKFPLIEPLHAVWSRGTAEVWAVGKETALRYDPTQVKDGGRP